MVLRKFLRFLEGRRKRYFYALFLERDEQKKLGPTALAIEPRSLDFRSLDFLSLSR